MHADSQSPTLNCIAYLFALTKISLFALTRSFQSALMRIGRIFTAYLLLLLFKVS